MSHQPKLIKIPFNDLNSLYPYFVFDVTNQMINASDIMRKYNVEYQYLVEWLFNDTIIKTKIIELHQQTGLGVDKFVRINNNDLYVSTMILPDLIYFIMTIHSNNIITHINNSFQ
jgi:hypothetical protein